MLYLMYLIPGVFVLLFLLLCLVGLVLGCTEWLFLRAARLGNLAVVKLFLRVGMSVETADFNDGWTALHLAASAGRLAVVKFLVGAGADVRARTDSGYTPLDLARSYRQMAVADYLESVGG